MRGWGNKTVHKSLFYQFILHFKVSRYYLWSVKVSKQGILVVMFRNSRWPTSNIIWTFCDKLLFGYFRYCLQFSCLDSCRDFLRWQNSFLDGIYSNFENNGAPTVLSPIYSKINKMSVKQQFFRYIYVAFCLGQINVW